MDPADVARELTELRRGRGLDAIDAHTRVGPLLRTLCGIAADDSLVAARRKLLLRLSPLLNQMPEDLQLAASVALALHTEATGLFLDRRIAWLAGHFDRDPRTARRRIDDAFRLLAQYLVDGPPTDSAVQANSALGWHVLALHATLRLDVDRPQLVERRRIMAIVDELDELRLAFSAPRSAANPEAGRIEIAAVYGGEIVERIDFTGSHAQFVLRLPRPLRLGQQHDYSVQVTSWSHAAMRPYYVLNPLRPTEHFSVRVKFDRATPPSRIWQLAGQPSRVIDDPDPLDDDLLHLDAVGEIALEFHDLKQGLNYGLQWRP